MDQTTNENLASCDQCFDCEVHLEEEEPCDNVFNCDFGNYTDYGNCVYHSVLAFEMWIISNFII